MHPFIALITILAVLQFFYFTFMVGQARGKHKVPAPRTDGPDGFLRAFRVQQNTLEQLVIFLPALWLCALYLHAPETTAGLGLLWLIGRAHYAHAYARGKNRFPGFFLNVSLSFLLAMGALWGIVQAALVPLG